MFNNYKNCVNNVVNVVYKNIAVGEEVMTENPLNSTMVTGNLRSYLKSVLAIKVSCHPKGSYAYNYKFSNQDKCLRDMVGISQSKYLVRVSAQKGDWYNALMGMSKVF